MALAIVLLLPSPGTALAAGAHTAGASPSVEEQRLAGRVPQEILRRSGFAAHAPAFAHALARTGSFGEAKRLAARQGQRLWWRAAGRAHGQGPTGEAVSRGDDRPLYWARLGMTRALRTWKPAFPLTDAQRVQVAHQLERSSRGVDSARLPQSSAGLRRVVVTGFDPFQLDDDIRRSNPSGAAALALDGTTVRTGSGERVRVEAMLFPVRWDDFTSGMVEKALLPALRAGPHQTDACVTLSQGSPGRFDVERFNGAWRGGSPDNVRTSRKGMAPIASGLPTPVPPPQWTRTTLPHRALADADTGPYPVVDHTSVTEIPRGGEKPVERPGGPTPGSIARAGGGGDYLSNEIGYRATRLRDALGARISGGHLHTPVLEFGTGNTDPHGRITDPSFERHRKAITDQVRTSVRVVAEHSHPDSGA